MQCGERAAGSSTHTAQIIKAALEAISCTQARTQADGDKKQNRVFSLVLRVFPTPTLVNFFLHAFEIFSVIKPTVAALIGAGGPAMQKCPLKRVFRPLQDRFRNSDGEN